MDELTGFLLYLESKGLRQATLEAHRDKWKQLTKYCPTLSDAEVAGFLLSLKEQGRKGTYINHILFTFRAYKAYKGLPVPNIPFFKEEESIKSTLSDEEIDRILNLKPPTKGAKSRSNWERWSLFFRITAYTGMRPGEVARLSVDSCDFGRQVFVLHVTKTVPRLVPIPTMLIKSLKHAIENAENGVLFPSRRRNDGFVNDVDWGYNFKIRLEKLGIVRSNLSVYSLRHSFITRMLEEDVNIFKVQKIVGHSRLETTAHYTHLTTKDIVKTIKKDPLTRRSNNQAEIAQAIAEAIKSFHLESDRRFKFTLTEGSNELEFKLTWI